MADERTTGDDPEISVERGRCPCRNLLEKEIDANDMALIAMCAGGASLIISLSMAPGWRALVGTVCGALAVTCGWLAARNECRYGDEAKAGMICGVVALCLQLLRGLL
jgi:hypothetical protein